MANKLKRPIGLISITVMAMLALASTVFSQQPNRISPDVPFRTPVYHSQADRETDLTQWLINLIERTDSVNLDWQKVWQSEINWVNRCELSHTALGSIQDYLKQPKQSTVENFKQIRSVVKKTDKAVFNALRNTCNIETLTDQFVY